MADPNRNVIEFWSITLSSARRTPYQILPVPPGPGGNGPLVRRPPRLVGTAHRRGRGTCSGRIRAGVRGRARQPERHEPLLAAGQEDHLELQPLGRVQGQQRDRVRAGGESLGVLVGDAALPRGASGPDATGAGVGGTKAVALDMSLAPGLAWCRWKPRPTFLAAAGRSAVGLKRDGSSPGCAARSW